MSNLASTVRQPVVSARRRFGLHLSAQFGIENPSEHFPVAKMMVSVFLALFLPCAGMSAVFIVYLCLLWYAASQANDFNSPSKPPPQTGLSPSDLEKLPKTNGHGLVLGSECAVCLDEIEPTDPARLLPGCNHGFHLQCADSWLSKHSVCPLCRSKIEPEFTSTSPENENPC